CRLDPCRDRIGRSRLAGAIQCDRLDEVQPRKPRAMPVVSAAHQFGLDLARGDQGGCRLTRVQLRDRQVEAEIANRLGIISLAGAYERPVELLYRLLRTLHSQSRLARESMPFDDRIDR